MDLGGISERSGKDLGEIPTELKVPRSHNPSGEQLLGCIVYLCIRFYVCVLGKSFWAHCLPLHSFSMYVSLGIKLLGPLSTFAFVLHACVFR